MFGKYLENVRNASPLIHSITNYVTVNDCANILLAAGASPIMSDDIGEVEDITTVCAALNINIGTLNRRTIPAMLAAGKKANEQEHPVVLDPVGAGASELRTSTAQELIQKIHFTVIRGNISEIKALATGDGGTKGVDAAIADVVNENTLSHAVDYIKAYAARMNTIVAVTGAIDIVSDGDRTYIIRNGRAEMRSVTGTGCMLSCLITATIAANPYDKLTATAAAVSEMGLAGELAFNRMSKQDGNASYCAYIIDAVYNMDAAMLDTGAKYEIK